MKAHACPFCECEPTLDPGAVDLSAPFHSLVVAVEAAWLEVMAEDRAAGRHWSRHRRPKSAA